jgi:HK97 family phage portal protein
MWSKMAGTWTDATKAIFGPPAKEPAHEMLIHQNTAEFTLTVGDFDNWVQEAYKKNEIVNRCLNMLINTVCEAPLEVIDADGEVIPNHPTQLLLQHINPHETQKQFLKRLLLYMYLGDIGFVEKVFTRGGKVTELGLLRPDKVKVTADDKIGVNNFIYEPGGEGKKFILDPRAVLMMQFIDPLNRLKGFSPLKALAMRIDTDNAHTQYTMAVLQNGGVPGSILKVSDFLDPAQATAMAKGFDQKTKDTKQGSTVVLHGGVEYESFGNSFRDLEAKELSKVDEAKILSGLGIPLPVFGGVSGTDTSTYDNMRTAFKIFWRQTVIPMQGMIEDYFNGDVDLLPPSDRLKGISIKFNLKNVEALKEDQDLLSERARLDFQSGLITINEARRAGGYDALPDGDELRSFGFDLPAESDEVKEEITKSEEPDVHTNDCACEHKEEYVAAEEEEDEEELEDEGPSKEDIALMQRNLNDFKIATKRMKLADKGAFSVFSLARKHLTKHIADIQAVIGTKATDKNELMTKQTDQKTLEQALLQLEGEWAVELASDSLDTIGKLVSDSAEEAAVSLGSSFSIEDEAVQQAIRTQQFKFGNGVARTSSKEIRKVILSSFEEGKSLKELRKDIQKLGDQFNKVRATTIARTETVRAANQGARTGYKSAGVTKLRYTAVLDGNTSEICDHLNGKIVGIDETFLSGEEGFTLSNGRPMDLSYDDGVPNPPAHPNCRSTIIPEFDNGGF